MARLKRGDVVTVDFDNVNGGTTRRPALVLAAWAVGNDADYMLCMITTRQPQDPIVIPITPQGQVQAGLKQASYVRPLRTMVITEGEIGSLCGTLPTAEVDAISTALQTVIGNGTA